MEKIYRLVGQTLIEVEDEEETEKREGWGPVVNDPVELVTWKARLKFFDAIHRITPVALESLRDDVLLEFVKLKSEVRRRIYSGTSDDEYLRLFKDRGIRKEQLLPEGMLHPDRGFLPVIAWPTLRAVAETYRPELKPVCQKLITWGERFYLTCGTPNTLGSRAVPDWVQNVAWSTLNLWDRYPALRRKMAWHPPKLIISKSSCGFELSPQKWQMQHYEWLALFQVECRSPREIADRLNCQVSENAILKGVYSAARIVGLYPRPGRRGPRSKKT
jgi:hypothetical protein